MSAPGVSTSVISVVCEYECPCSWCEKRQTVDSCGYEGDLYAEVDGGTVRWTCPWCGGVHEEDARDRFGADPDEAYERERDEAVTW